VLLTDVLALSFSYNALSLLKLDSFKTGSILLSGLFVYDVWWVFGTDVVREFDLVDWSEVLNEVLFRW
jgi:minor histocompatibility antigen H13